MPAHSENPPESELIEKNCWEVIGCPEEVRKDCPAFPEHGRECWKVTGTTCGAGKYRMAAISEKILYCRSECDYFRRYLNPSLITLPRLT
jgi:hypothetical protein